MKHLKKFERFDLNLSESINTNICNYSCDECDNIWKDEQDCKICKSCGSDEIEELHEEEWNELSKMRLENN